MKNSIRSLAFASTFVALGIVLPMAFHMIGGAGPVFLPMHIPVLVAGFFLNWPLALLVGVMTPFLSALMTGMPPIFPMMPIMMLELGTYGMVISLLRSRFVKWPYMSLVIAMVLGRVAAGFMVYVLATFFAAKLPPVSLFIQGALVKGAPGIVIQLIFVPALVFALTKSKIFTSVGEV
jgi:hypothetical protein